MSKGLSTTSHRLLSSTKRKNHICRRMTSDATLVFSSCPSNTPMIGLHWFRGTKDLDLVGVFYVAVPPRVVESALVPYPYPGFINTCLFLFHRRWLFPLSFFFSQLGSMMHSPYRQTVQARKARLIYLTYFQNNETFGYIRQ